MPDYDLSTYQRDITTDYVFMNKWRFPDKYLMLFDWKILSTKIFHYDHILDISKDAQIPYQDNHCTFLNKVLSSDPMLLDQHGFDPDLDEFKLSHLREKGINNDGLFVEYEGSFLGDSHTIDPLDWKLYAMIELEGMTFLSGLDFYKTLLAESYVLWRERKNKLSYFLLHAAFESFVNFELNSADSESRLPEKVNELFVKRFAVLAKHQIYCSIIQELAAFSSSRNTIAHGRKRIEITNANLKKAFVFVLTLIATYQERCLSFTELNDILNRQQLIEK